MWKQPILWELPMGKSNVKNTVSYFTTLLKKFQNMYVFCKLLILFTLLHSYNSFANICEGGFSPAQRHLLREPHVQNAQRKLEQDLKKIRNSPQEPLLKAQGFTPSYYAGVDLVREFNRVQQYLEEIKADPNHTHISYFADQVAKTISDFEKDFREQIKEKIVLEKRLKFLEDFREEIKTETYHHLDILRAILRLESIKTLIGTSPFVYPSETILFEFKRILREQIKENPDKVVLKSFLEHVDEEIKALIDFTKDFIETSGMSRQADSYVLLNDKDISYFADQVEKTLSSLERNVREQTEEKTEFLEERLKLLEDFKGEAQRKVANQEVTYDWWTHFNLRLAFLATKDMDIYTVDWDPDWFSNDNFTFIDSFRTHKNMKKTLKLIYKHEPLDFLPIRVYTEFPANTLFFFN